MTIWTVGDLELAAERFRACQSDIWATVELADSDPGGWGFYLGEPVSRVLARREGQHWLKVQQAGGGYGDGEHYYRWKNRWDGLGR